MKTFEEIRDDYCKAGGFDDYIDYSNSLSLSDDEQAELGEKYAEQFKGVGLDDSEGNPLRAGDIVISTKSLSTYLPAGIKFIVVFNVPNHRYGLKRLIHEEYDQLSTWASEQVYLTPRSASKIKVINNDYF